MMPCNPCPPFPSEEEGSQLCLASVSLGGGPTRCQGAREKAGENSLGEEVRGVGEKSEQQSPVLSGTRVGFVEDSLSMNRAGEWFRMIRFLVHCVSILWQFQNIPP